jgi:hypothetical protein
LPSAPIFDGRRVGTHWRTLTLLLGKWGWSVGWISRPQA